jgi:hypothetical protein
MSREEQVENNGRHLAGHCEEAARLRNALIAAIRELNALSTEQVEAVISEDSDFGRFDLLIHMANEKKDQAKYALLQHLESHRCQET